ncbi:cytochrome c [Lewinella sp. W8]|uniref:c-type cytochrome n=1 Tax=Lewinella sp. W8 TaxID=2528208 RepID=UPI0010687C58|nr:cytochrome c [Lewinella sp. W8]MTB52641.1 c-type cytochrome [Lewinella sp. W8]
MLKLPSKLQTIFAFLLTAGLFFILHSCTEPAPDGSFAKQAEAGEAHFMKYCARCHGEDGKGIVIDSLGTQPADLTQIMKGRRSKEFPILEVAFQIDGREMAKAHGARDMPVWGEVFSEEEYMNEGEIKGKLGELIAYIIEIQE